VAEQLLRQTADSPDRLIVWTFCIVGGSSFTLSVPGNPSLDHNGRSTLWKFVGTKDQAAQAECLINHSTDAISVTVYAETETTEQYLLRHTPDGWDGTLR
jgi:hypothetical protein